MVKTAGRTAEENDVYLAFPVDFYNLAKLKLEGLVPPAVADKKRHSLFRRRIHFVETGKALRVNTEFSASRARLRTTTLSKALAA